MIEKTTPPTAATLHISEAQPLISAVARKRAASPRSTEGLACSKHLEAWQPTVALIVLKPLISKDYSYIRELDFENTKHLGIYFSSAL